MVGCRWGVGAVVAVSVREWAGRGVEWGGGGGIVDGKIAWKVES